MVFPADMLRDSYQTIEVRNIMNDSLNEEEKSSDMSSIFDEINIIDCDRTIRAKSDLTGSEYRLNMAEVPSGIELDKTIQLSIEHCINFDIRDSNAILNQLNAREAAMDDDINNCSQSLFRSSQFGKRAAENYEHNKASMMSTRFKDPMLDDDDFDDQESCSTQHDQKVNPSIIMNKTFTTKNGMIVDL